MTAQELNAYIDKVLGNSLRCLLPSYWWRRLLKLVVEYAESVNAKVDNLKDTVDNLDVDVDLSDYATKQELSDYATKSDIGDVDGKVDNVYEKIRKVFGITVSCVENGFADVLADGKKVRIQVGMTKRIPVDSTFSFDYAPRNVKSIDLSFFDSSKMTDMSNLFAGCSNLTYLDVSYLDASNVTDMSRMFANCSSLKNLELEGFDTSNATNMEEMFCNCGDGSSNIYFLYLAPYNGFNTSKVTNMRNMFKGMSLRFSISSFDTSNVTDMSGMFENCRVESPYTTLDFDTSNVRDMSNMFLGFNPMYLTLGAKFFKTAYVTSIDLSGNEDWHDSYFIDSVVTNSYDRTANGLATLELKIHAKVYAYLTDEHKATLAAKGYTIVV